jgi:eukaryotic-like serine/threonine-protein kinase
VSEHEQRAFVDRVMTAIETVPAPTPVRAFGWSLRTRAGRDALASLLVAWHLGTVRAWSVAPRVRARSMALVLAVASVLATGSIVAAAAVRVAVPDSDPRPPTATPGVSVSAPIVDGPGVDGPDQNAIEAPSGRPEPTASAGTEPTARPSDMPTRDAQHPADGAAGTTGTGESAKDDGDDTGGSQDRSGPAATGGTDRTDDGDGANDGETDRRDGGGDSGRDDGGDGGHGGDSGGGGDD